MDFALPKSVTICDKTLRQGVQNEEKFIPTATKVFLANALADAGFKHMELGTFAHPAFVPQFRDLEDVLKKVKRRPDIEYICITLSKKAVERAAEAKKQGYGPELIEIVVAMDEELNKAAFGGTNAESFQLIEYAVKLTNEVGQKLHVTIDMDWRGPRARAYEFADRLVNMGVTQISHSGSRGEDTPKHIYEYFSEVRLRHPKITHIYVHHDLRGFGLANYVAAMQAGITRLDTTMGGTGGWPPSLLDCIPVAWANECRITRYSRPVKTGLVSTEDFVVLCHAMGVETGLDVNKILNIGRWVERIFDRTTWSYAVPLGSTEKVRLQDLV